MVKVNVHRTSVTKDALDDEAEDDIRNLLNRTDMETRDLL
jgi:hypothetical protein